MSKPLRLLKFDTCHPRSYLARLQVENRSVLDRLSYEDYYHWLMERRVGLSDYLTHHMNEAGWEAREVIGNDPLLLEKLQKSGRVPASPLVLRALATKQNIASSPLRHLFARGFGFRYVLRYQEELLASYIRSFRPDVLFVREPCHMDGRFFSRFAKNCLVTSFIACNTNHPINWDAHRNDVIFTLTPEYLNFFRAQGLEAHIFEYGVDERVAQETADLPKIHDCSFVGYLGVASQSRKTELMNAVAAAVNFKWWGIKGPELGKYPHLERSWQGETAGIDMLRIYKQSKIVLNDYVDMAMGKNVNIRTMEVLGVGTLLLTRAAENIEWLEKEGALVTFRNGSDCIAAINRFLVDDAGREKIAMQGLRTALQKFNYRDVTQRLMSVIAAAHEKKAPHLSGWS